MRLFKQKFSDLNLLNHGLLLLSINLSLLVVVLKGSGFELALLLTLTCFVLLLITTTLLSLRLKAYSTQISFLPTYIILVNSGIHFLITPFLNYLLLSSLIKFTNFATIFKPNLHLVLLTLLHLLLLITCLLYTSDAADEE